MDKIREASKSHAKMSIDSTPLQTSESQRIPPSGTPVKSEHDDIPISNNRFINHFNIKSESNSPLSHASSRNLSDLEDICPNEESIQIAFLKPRFSEFTHIVPSFPKTHPDGYAYIIELSPEILNEKAILSFRDALQYSLTGGGGPKLYENVKFFASDDGSKVPMKIHSRRCAGII